MSVDCHTRRGSHGRTCRCAWYGRILDEILAVVNAEGIVLVGNSLGAAVALAADSPRIRARALVSPAGVVRLTVNPRLALASAAWLLRPTPEHARHMLRLFVAPDTEPPETDVEWMALMATCCRTTLTPPPLPAELLARRAETLVHLPARDSTALRTGRSPALPALTYGSAARARRRRSSRRAGPRPPGLSAGRSRPASRSCVDRRPGGPGGCSARRRVR
ncbi:alpha/beta hydrolase, partial [Actinophytocola oryzae]|uniref:alpha/beta hydrolase n=1 Tax=Actinophytocola oryzae TaxID=502181 RepID=UPI0010624315